MINNISFPRLGLEFTINRVAFSIFGKPIYWYGIIIALGFALGVFYAIWRAKKEGIGADAILDVVLWGVPTCIICARIFYVIGDPDILDGGFWKIIAVWEGGIAIFGALIGAVIVGLTYSRIKKIDTGLLFDVAAPAIMIGQIVGRFGNFVNAEVYGGVTDSLFGMSINGTACVAPLFLYESSWMLLGLVLVLIYQKYKKVNGEIFLLYAMLYSAGRIFLETLRQDEYVLKIFGLPMSQITAVAAFVCALAIYMYIRFVKKKKPENDNVSEQEEK
ncbi:MAG: prolipoprotein diacylglyceryl transferase [Ruminococcaceae bacterium]|nr:prolipoprotein diacylglyceryl transferase [Oscillospiraceae bacterium]